MTGYSLEGLVLNQWAPLEHFADGRWRRVWRIVLANALPPDIDWEGVSKEAQGAGFNVSFDEKGTREIDAIGINLREFPAYWCGTNALN